MRWLSAVPWDRPVFHTCQQPHQSPNSCLSPLNRATYAANKVIYRCERCSWFKYNREIHFSVRKVNARVADLSYSWHVIRLFMMPVLTTTSTLPMQPRPWRHCAHMRPDRRHSGWINPRTNEQLWQDWKWKENKQIRGIEMLLSLSILCASPVSSNHTIHPQVVPSEPLTPMGVISCG